MSMWNTLSAGLQKVQQSLDQVLEGEQTDGQQVAVESERGGLNDPQQSTVLHQPGGSQTTPPSATPIGGDEGLREALVASEQQMQLINIEYRKLLEQKESEIHALRSGLSTHTNTGSGDQSLEVARKELAAHKEMVAELRGQLVEKELEFQELNSKAESKFHKLKTQAKNKIASLSKEVEGLRAAKGEESPGNLSTLSLDDSIASSVGGATLLSHPQLESLRSEVKSKTQLISDLRDELELSKKEKSKMADQLCSLTDKLNVSEVCLQQERESVIGLQLQTTRLEEEVGGAKHELAVAVGNRDTALEELKNETTRLEEEVCGAKHELAVAVGNRDTALEELKNETEIRQGLQDQVTDLIGRQEDGGAGAVVASSQVVNENSESPVPVTTSPTPVLAAGSRGSLLDLEGEVGRLETTLQSREQQLSSFKTILDEKEQSLAEEKLTNSNLTAQLDEKTIEIEHLHQQILLSQSEIEETKETLTQKEVEIVNLQETLADVQNTHRSLQDSLNNDADEMADNIQSLEQKVTEKESTAAEIERSMDKLTESLAVTKEGLVASQQEGEQLTEQLAEREHIIRKLEETLSRQENDLTTADQRLESALKEIDEQTSKISQTEEKIAELLTEKEVLLKQSTELENKCSHVTGGLEFAQQELTTKDDTIKGLTHALEEKKTLTSDLESQIATIKSGHAEKLTELVQHKEQAMQSRSDLDHQVSQLQRTLDSRETQLTREQEAIKKLQANYENIRQELVESHSRLSILERETEEKQIERETLRGQVDNLSQMESSFSSQQTQFETELADLKIQLSQKTSQITDMQQKLRSAKQQLQKAAKAKQEFSDRKESFESELEKYKKENEQMKEQFDSAVKMMEAKLANQTTALSQVTTQLSEKDTLLLALKKQLDSKQQNTLALEKKLNQLSTDQKMATERSQILEQEKEELANKMAELSGEYEHTKQLLTEVRSSSGSLQLEHEALLRQSQEGEGQMVMLTQQLGQLAREKQDYEDKVRELSRQLVASEQRQLGLNVQLEELQQHSHTAQSWEIEKQDVLESENTALQTREAQLQAQLGQLQVELAESVAQLESVRQGSDVENALLNEEQLQKRLAAHTEAHLSETTQLQQSLDREREHREEAERKLGELQGDVVITMDDLGVSDQLAAPQNFMDYVAVANSWMKRFIKNPNVVLTRLYRATPRTKLFFLAYFVLLHFVLLYFIFV